MSPQYNTISDDKHKKYKIMHPHWQVLKCRNGWKCALYSSVRLKCYFAFLLVCCGCDTSYIVSVHIQCQAFIYTLSLCREHSWRVRLAKQETLTPPDTWSHLWFAGVRECPPRCSIVGATVTVHQFSCILHWLKRDKFAMQIKGDGNPTSKRLARVLKHLVISLVGNRVTSSTLPYDSLILFVTHSYKMRIIGIFVCSVIYRLICFSLVNPYKGKTDIQKDTSEVSDASRWAWDERHDWKQHLCFLLGFTPVDREGRSAAHFPLWQTWRL